MPETIATRLRGVLDGWTEEYPGGGITRHEPSIGLPRDYNSGEHMRRIHALERILPAIEELEAANKAERAVSDMLAAELARLRNIVAVCNTGAKEPTDA